MYLKKRLIHTHDLTHGASSYASSYAHRRKHYVMQNDTGHWGPVHTMPDKFENTTLLLRICLKKIQQNIKIRIKRSKKTELFENAFQSGTI